MDIARLVERDLHKPVICSNCGERLEYKGVGEYKCPECKNLEYDDYGKVRNYLEKHRGATQGEVSEATGVAPNTIRALLKADKLEVAPGSAVFMVCEACGQSIRSGRFCDSCQAARNAQMQNAQRGSAGKNVQGFGKGSIDTSGARRFTR